MKTNRRPSLPFKLVVEQNSRAVAEPIVHGGTLLVTPPLDEDFWVLRVRVSASQSLVVFPKFGTFGCGFAKEKDWNTNLPIASPVATLWDHIKHNRAGAPEVRCQEALQMLREEARRLELFDDDMEQRLDRK